MAAAAATALVAYVPFFRSLASVSAGHPYAGHVVFVPIFAAALLWLERHRFRRLAKVGHASGAAVMVLALGLLAFGYTSASVRLQALSLVMAVAGILLSVYGPGSLRATGFVLAFLLLTIPPPREAVAALAPDVQRVVAAFAAVVLESLHIPVVHEGVFLRLPGLTLEVAEECAGLRFSLILLVFVTAFARAVLPTRSSQLALVGLAIPVAMLANAMRVAVTGIGAYAIGPHVATGPLHYYIGKGFWALAILGMIAIAWGLRARTSNHFADRRIGSGRCVAGAS
jgi:exosortase